MTKNPKISIRFSTKTFILDVTYHHNSEMCLCLDEASYWAEKLLTDINSPPFMPDEDNNFDGFLTLDWF